jgi:predicted nuclease of predicted toxin-antitoxin system
MLGDAGHDVVHVADRGMSRATDAAVVALAVTEARVIVCEDTDFGALLASAGGGAPSFVLLRGAEPMTPEDQAALLLANLPAVEDALTTGAVVVFAPGPSPGATAPDPSGGMSGGRDGCYGLVVSGAIPFRFVRSREGHAGVTTTRRIGGPSPWDTV